MGVYIRRILNKPVDSNSFVVYSKDQGSCVVIDPGTEDCRDLINFLDKNSLKPEFILLTHEHFDHVWGVNKLKDSYNPSIVCSGNCAVKIRDNKKNMSLFYDQIGFTVCPADIIIEDLTENLVWKGIPVEWLITPGHTDASVCYLIDNHLFTGDTLILDTPTVTKLPTGNKEKLKESLELLETTFRNRKIIVHSGHKEDFWYDPIQIQKLL
ncbi:MAG: MBL fold metallo-hydrolase [Bacteroidetes bacterium]|nr:MBL fold metallo-hydrolase [Bacteroidota bacterium]